MLVNANTNETGLFEMSYRCFVYYRSTGGPYTVSTLSMDGGECSTDYDSEMVTSDYLMASTIQPLCRCGAIFNRTITGRQGGCSSKSCCPK